MIKTDVIDIATAMGFHMNYDQWDAPDKEWIRFELPKSLNEQEMRWIWWKDVSLVENLRRGAQILFLAGQKAKVQDITLYNKTLTDYK